ncbi:hypothetical protein AQUSIP_24750 [Aquicella siphonis]|uniref:Tetratricopeptide repeat protein n=1 Tax=Aquicella siphonis TaxID=254247 RepID=A0A5E4PKR7_9COXI|nr:hypothetical protein [Aquicella siphonis]VVC77148.1 hypothetical protein AQUSIP_24750 [Aquicella siphonis]
MRNFLLFIFCLSIIVCPVVYAAQPQEMDIQSLRKSIILGDVRFDVTTKNAAAKEHFLLGAAFLHAFMYDLAIRQFQAAEKLDPGFAMSYWGEAMANKHPIWNFENLAAGQAVLSRYEQHKDQRSLTEKEKYYLDSVKKLFSDQSLLDRDRAYYSAMKVFYEHYPKDPNVGAFYALSQLGLASDFPDDPSSPGYLRTGRKLIDYLFTQFSDHPGVVHYYLHYHDTSDRKLAGQALPAARIALTVMRSSSHVTHMAAHIYRRLELWDDYILANQISVTAADTLCKMLNDYPLYACNAENKYHSLEWLQDGYLKKGKFKQAQKLVDRIRDAAARDKSVLYKQWYYRMWARQVLVSQNWNIPALRIQPITKRDEQIYWSAYSECGALLASSFLAIHKNQPVESQLKRLNKLIKYANGIPDPYIRQACQIARLEVKAEFSRCHNDKENAAYFTNKALALQKKQISTELTPSLSFLSANEYYQNYVLAHKK